MSRVVTGLVSIIGATTIISSVVILVADKHDEPKHLKAAQRAAWQAGYAQGVRDDQTADAKCTNVGDMCIWWRLTPQKYGGN